MPRLWQYLLIAISLLAVGFLQLYLLPFRNVPIIYAIPILLAAVYLPAAGVVVTGAACTIVNVLGIVAEGTPLQVWPFTLASLLATIVLGVLVSQQRRQVELQAERAEAHRREIADIVESIADAFVTLDSEWRFTYANNMGASLFEAERDELVGRAIWDVLPAGLDGTFEAQLRRAAAERKPTEWEADFRGRWLSFRAYPYGQGVSIYARDITRRKRAEEERERLLDEVQRRAAELEAIISSIVDGVYVVDAHGRTVMANKAALEFLGATSIEEVNRGRDELIERSRIRHPDGRPVAWRDLPEARALAGETVLDESLVAYVPRAGRDLSFRASAAPIRDPGGRLIGAVVVVRDVTELVELDRLKDEFIRVAAHELKTPVAIMKGYAQALLRSPTIEPARRNKMLEAIDHGADRITRLIDDLLDISQLQLGQITFRKERVDLTGLVRSVVDEMAPTAPKHSLRLIKAEPAVVHGDEERLAQVVRHLIANAIKYSPKGGNVDIAVRTQNGEAVVSVRDYGIGIPKERQARIFERFYRAHTGTPYDYAGMGVGLYISREIVRAHGGRIWFESEPGKGSTFHFALPLATK